MSKCLRRILFDVLRCLKSVSFQNFLKLWEQEKVTRCEIWGVWRLLQLSGAVFGQKLLHKIWCVCGRIVLVQDPVAIPPLFWSFSTNWFTQTSRDLQDSLLIVCLLVAFSWCTIPSESKTASNMSFVLLPPSLNRWNQSNNPLHLHCMLAAIIDTFLLWFFQF